MDGNFSYLSPLGYQSGSSCGYCKPNPSACYWAKSFKNAVHPGHYQQLVDRGWRRSGKQYYKPDVRHSCCPHYTIRLDAAAFKSTKDQRQAVNRFRNYILGEDYVRKAARLCPRTREEKKERKNRFNLSERLHDFEYKLVKKPIDPSTKKPIEPAHNFEITLEPDNLTEEKLRLFAHYQIKVHKEPPSKSFKSSFKSFLCSGLGQRSIDFNGRQRKLGSFHQCYRLDGRLVAMGVLDLLPHGVSSVYLLYHESVNDWNFGKISAMHEILLALEEGYHYYYMGYYIHSCIKMRYKANFHPTYILDPESYTWDPLSPEFLKRLSARPYVSLSRERHLSIKPSKDDASVDFQNSDLNLTIYPDFDPESSSLFDANMPGVMTIDEVQAILPDLENWRLKIGCTVLALGDITDWSTTSLTDTFTIKGLAAEFAATVGLDFVRNSVIEWTS